MDLLLFPCGVCFDSSYFKWTSGVCCTAPQFCPSESRDQLHSRGTFARQIFGSASLERKCFEDTTKGFFFTP